MLGLPILLATLVVSTSAQTFSFDTVLGTDGIAPTFDSQRSSSVIPATSPSRGSSSRSSNISPAISFQEFFSSSRIASPTSSRSPSPTSSTPARTPSRAVTSSVPADTTPSRTRDSSSVPSRSSSSFSSPQLSSRGAPLAAVSEAPSTVQRPSFPPVLPSAQVEITRSRSRARTNFPTPSDQQSSSPAILNPGLSSRGRVAPEVVETEVKAQRPSSPPTEANSDIPDVRDNLVGQSICARGTNGDACRKHLATTAMSCTSGFCKECQQCGSLSPDLWPKCCREHFLCCRQLGKACQRCDLPVLQPFCSAAFGRCQN